MTDIKGLFSLQGELFLLMALGILFKKRKIVGQTFQKGLTEVLISLILPCNIIVSFEVEFNGEVLRQTSVVLVISLLVQVGCWLVSFPLFRRCAPEQRPVLQYATICSNAGFLGTPVAEGIFGYQGTLLSAVYLIPMRIAMWTLGVSFFAKEERGPVWKKVLTHPCIIATEIGMVVMLAGIQLPDFLDRTLHAVSSCNTAMAMFLIGLIISNLSWRDFLRPVTLYFTAVRLVLIPLLVLVCCRLAHVDQLPTSLAVVLAAMPAGSTTAILAEKYGGNAAFAGSCVTVSTVLSLIAIPIWCMVL